jgi:hypothetical protein
MRIARLLLCASLLAVFSQFCLLSEPAAQQNAVPGDRWMEIDLYWFEQSDIAASVDRFWDRFQPLYTGLQGERGVILNVGWTVGYIMEWSGDLDQRISLPEGKGQQPWVAETAPLPGTTEDRMREWKARFASPKMVERRGYEAWTYRDLRTLAKLLREAAQKRGIGHFRVGSLAYAWDNAYGEVAPWAKRHPEAFTHWRFPQQGTFDVGSFFDPAAPLHRDDTKLGGLPQGIAEGTTAHAAFAAQWGSLSRAAGLDAIMLRDSFGMPVPYQRAGPNGVVEPAPALIERATESVSALVRETKTANPRALVMMYSNAASAAGDWRSNGLDLERIAKEGYLDIWVDQTWAGAWNEAGVRHDNFWNQPTLGWTYQLANMLMHAATLADTGVKHYPLVETFDAWESWDVLHTVPERLRWGIWAYSHAAVKTPRGIKVPAGTYISWANQGKRLLSDEDVAFLAGNIGAAVTDARKVTEVYGPTLVYARTSAQWQSQHARPGVDVKEWLDEQAGSILKWPVPILSATRIEWLPQVHSDLFILGAPSHLAPGETDAAVRLAKSGQPMAFLGSPAGGIDPVIAKLAGLTTADAQHDPPQVLQATASATSASLVSDLPSQFPVQQGLTRNRLAPGAEPLYSAANSPLLVLNTTAGRRLLAWDPPEFTDLCCKPLKEIWGGSAAPYALAAAALNSLVSALAPPHGDTQLHAAQIQIDQTFTVGAWKTSGGSLHILAGNLEEGLREDADMSRSATIVLPRSWHACNWKSVWSGAPAMQARDTLQLHLGAAGSLQLQAEVSEDCAKQQ